jgi:hypothetical protein
MTGVELLYWDGCPSHPQALAELEAAIAELGEDGLVVGLREITTEEEAAAEGFVGSPTIRVGGVDLVPVLAGEPTGLTCRIYRRRDGRYSPTPDPADLRDRLGELLSRSTEEA